MNIQKGFIKPEINKNGLKTILVPTDFSEKSDMALRSAIDIAKRQNARIYLLHVERSPKIAIEKERMEAQIGKFPDAKAVEIIPDIRKGSPYKEILNVQAEKEIDLIMISWQGRTGLSDFITGNITDKVVKRAKCSVMVIGN